MRGFAPITIAMSPGKEFRGTRGLGLLVVHAMPDEGAAAVDAVDAFRAVGEIERVHGVDANEQHYMLNAGRVVVLAGWLWRFPMKLRAEVPRQLRVPPLTFWLRT